MRTRRVIASSIYVLGQLGLGLLLHPYQTMQSIVQDKVFLMMTLFPSCVLAVVTVGWRFGVVPFVRLFFSCRASGLTACQLLPFLSDWITFFCIYWQVLLLYLFFRFSAVFKTES